MNKEEIGFIKSLFEVDITSRLHHESDPEYQIMEWKRKSFEVGLESREKLEMAKIEFQIKMEELSKSKPWWKLW